MMTTRIERGERRPDPSGEATVMLDIGASRGALVVYLSQPFDGEEVEIRPLGESWTGRHTGVRRRDVRAGACFAAVYGSLAPGPYELRQLGTGDNALLDVAIEAGRVTEAEWPTEVVGTPVASGSHHLSRQPLGSERPDRRSRRSDWR
jgi:hypothetical protein